MRRRGQIQARQRGVALVIVLLLLASLAVIAIVMTQNLRLSVARTTASEDIAQARWYALGAEIFASQVLEAQAAATPGIDTWQEDWLTEQVTLPLETGMITAALSDASVCFNINSLVAREEGRLSANEDAVQRYRLLLGALGFDIVAQRALSDTVVDWLDSDRSVRSGGAEDADYARLDQPYRTGNTLMADISELRAVMWYTPQVYTALRPYLCALPDTAPSEININLVTQAQAPVLYAALEDVLSVEEVANLILLRPSEGYAEVAQFWSSSVFQGRDVPQELRERTVLVSTYVRMIAQIRHNGAEVPCSPCWRLPPPARYR